MPNVKLGNGVNKFTGEVHQDSIFENLDDLLPEKSKIEKRRKSTLTAKFVTSISKLQEELKSTFGIAASIHGTEASAQVKFIRKIDANELDTFYVLDFSEQRYVEYLPSKLVLDKSVKDYLDTITLKPDSPESTFKNNFLLLKGFCDRYGHECVDSITYGGKIVCVIKLKKAYQDKLTQIKGNATLQLPVGNIKADDNFKFTLKQLNAEAIEEVYFYISDGHNPYKALKSHISDTNSVIELVSKKAKDFWSWLPKSASGPKITTTSQTGAPKDGNSSNVNNDHNASSKLKTDDSSKEESGDKPPNNAVSTEDDEIERLPPSEAIKKLEQISYHTSPYANWFPGHQVTYILNENVKDIQTVLEVVCKMRAKILAFKEMTALAQNIFDKLVTTPEKISELRTTMTRLDAWLEEIMHYQKSFINSWFLLYLRNTGDAYNLNEKIDELNNILGQLNSLNSELIKFQRSLYLLKEAEVNVSTYFEGHRKLIPGNKHANRNSHYFKLPLFPEAKMLYLEIESIGRNPGIDINDITFDLIKRGTFSDDVIAHNISSGNFIALNPTMINYQGQYYIGNVRINNKRHINVADEERQFKIKIYVQTNTKEFPMLYADGTGVTIYSPLSALFDKDGKPDPNPKPNMTSLKDVSLVIKKDIPGQDMSQNIDFVEMKRETFQKNWNCFELALAEQGQDVSGDYSVNLRNQVVDYALKTENVDKCRKLLAPEILAAIMVTYIQKKPDNIYGLPTAMEAPNLKRLFNRYSNCCAQKEEAIKECNLSIADHQNMSASELDNFFAKNANQKKYNKAFKNYKLHSELTQREQELFQALRDYAQDSNIYKEYLAKYYRTYMWVGFQGASDNTSIIDIYAMLLGVKIAVYQTATQSTSSKQSLQAISISDKVTKLSEKPVGLELRYATEDYSPKDSPKVIYIKYNGIDHFTRLLPTVEFLAKQKLAVKPQVDPAPAHILSAEQSGISKIDNTAAQLSPVKSSLSVAATTHTDHQQEQGSSVKLSTNETMPPANADKHVEDQKGKKPSEQMLGNNRNILLSKKSEVDKDSKATSNKELGNKSQSVSEGAHNTFK